MITIGTKIDEIRIDGNLGAFRSDLEKFAACYLPSYSGLMIMELRSRYFGALQESRANLVQIIDSLNSRTALRGVPALYPPLTD